MEPMPPNKRNPDITTIQVSTGTRDRLFRLKFRKTYDDFLHELCDLFEASARKAQKMSLAEAV
jgi:hypothetical protein